MSVLSGLVLGLTLTGILSLLFYQAKTGVAAVPSTSREIAVVIALLRAAGLPSNSIIYELGCGWGSMAVELARAFPQSTIIGFELSPLPYVIARVRAGGHTNLAIRWRDFRKEQSKASTNGVSSLLTSLRELHATTTIRAV